DLDGDEVVLLEDRGDLARTGAEVVLNHQGVRLRSESLDGSAGRGRVDLVDLVEVVGRGELVDGLLVEVDQQDVRGYVVTADAQPGQVLDGLEEHLVDVADGNLELQQVAPMDPVGVLDQRDVRVDAELSEEVDLSVDLVGVVVAAALSGAHDAPSWLLRPVKQPVHCWTPR